MREPLIYIDPQKARDLDRDLTLQKRKEKKSAPAKDGVETEIFRQIRNAETEIRNDFEI